MTAHVKDSVAGTSTLQPDPVPFPYPAARAMLSTSWTIAAGGNFNAAGNWSNGVPTSGVDATIAEASNDSITVTISAASDVADALVTQFAGLLLSNGSLTLQGTGAASSISTGTGTALTENGGLLDFQNGPSQSQASSIAAGGNAVVQTAGTIEVDAGLLAIGGTSSFAGSLTGAGAITLNGPSTYSFANGVVVTVAQLTVNASATASFGGNLTYAGGFTESGGATLALNAHTLTLGDTATLGDAIEAYVTTGTLVNTAQMTLENAVIDSNTTIRNAGLILLDTASTTALTMVTDGTTAPLLANNAGHMLEAENGSYAIFGGSISNTGEILLGTAGSLAESAVLTSSGSIVIGAGDTFNAENSTTISGVLAGAAAGAGTFTLTGAGTDTINTATKVSVGAFVLNVFNDNVTLNIDTTSITSTLLALEQGGNVNFNTSLTYGGTFAASANASTLFLNLGANTLTLTGRASFAPGNFGSMEVTGTGLLDLRGATSLTLDPLAIGDGCTFENAGTLTQSASVQIGDTLGTAAVINAAGGVWDILAGTIGSSGSNLGSGFLNAGLFENTGSTGTALVGSTVTNTGTISAAAGYETDFYAGIINSGTLSGGGILGLRGNGTYTLQTGSVLSAAQLNFLDSATLSLGANAAFGGTFYDVGANSNSTVIALGADTFSLSGNVFLAATEATGSGKLALSGTTTISAYQSGGLLIGGGATLLNSGTLVQDDNVQLGDASGISSGATNTAAGTWTLANGYGLNRGSNAGVTFLNLGLFQNTDQGTADAIAPNFTNSGTVSVVAGAEIDFTNDFVNTGLIAGAGALGIRGSGNGTLAAGGTLSVAQINLFDNGTLSLGGNITYAGGFTDEGGTGSVINLAGDTLTLTGQSSFGNAYNGVLASVTGGGALDLAGIATVTAGGNGIDIGGTTTVLNSGTVQQANQVVIGDGSGALASVTNTGTWNLETSAGIYSGSNSGSSFTNKGLLQNDGAATTQTITAVFGNTGTVMIDAGDETDLVNLSTLGGTLTGAGSLGIRGSGSATLVVGGAVGVSQLILADAASLKLNEALTYAGTFNDEGGNGTTLNLNAKTMTLKGQSNFGNAYQGVLAYVTGGGTLSNAGTLDITAGGNGLEIGSTSALTNSATVIQSNTLQIGDSSGNIATVTNTGKWNTTSGANINTGSNASSSFTNTGTYSLIGTNASQSIFASFTNAGTISVNAGDVVYLSNSFANTGSVAGGGGLAFNNSAQATFAAGTKLTIATITLENAATLSVAASLTYGGNFVDNGTTGTTLNIAANTLTFSGTASFGNAYSGILAYVTGTGTLALTGATTITDTGYGVDFGGSLAVINSGALTQNGGVEIGDSGGGLAHITNTATGTWSLASGNGISLGGNASDSFTNAGLLQTTGTGNSVAIGVVFTTTGILDVVNATSTIAFTDGGSLGGTLEGAGTLAFDGGLFTLGSATTLGTGAIGLHGSGTMLQIGASETYGGALTLDTGAALSLATATTLTLSGQDSLASLVSGSGTLVAAASSALAVDGLTLGGSAVLQDSGLMAIASGLTIGNASTSSAALAVAAGGVFKLVGDATIGANGSGAISNAGTIEMVQGTGTATIDPLVTNSGAIFSQSGTLAFAAAVTNNGTMTALNGDGLSFGSSLNAGGAANGVIDLTAGGFAAFNGFVGTAETLTFTDATSSVANLLAPSGFDGTISGFSGQNDIHLFNFGHASDTFANNTLSLTGTTSSGSVVTAALHFSAGYTKADFLLTSDGGSGTNITFV